MARWFVVDAHNALHRLVASVPESPEAQRRMLLVHAREAVRGRRGGARTGDRVLLVFDAAKGGPWAGTHGRDGDVTWTYADGSADEEIVALVRAGGGRHEGHDLVVVTDDRELAGRASQLGAETRHVHAWFAAHDVEEEREARTAGPPMTGADFGFTRDVIDLDKADPDDL